MIKQNAENIDIDELLLNVLGGEFFKARKIPARFLPVIPKSLKHEFADQGIVKR